MKKLVVHLVAFTAIGLVALNALDASALALTGVKSRKVHGAAGQFDLTIDITQTLGTSVTVEPRVIGSGHVIVFQFDTVITTPGVASAVDPFGSIGTVSAPAITGAGNNEVSMTLTGISDNKRVTVSLSQVNGLMGGLGDFAVSMGFLVGDVDITRVVNSVDISRIKVRSGRPASAATFIHDLNAAGAINSADISAAKSRLGLPLVSVSEVSLSVAKPGTGTGSVTSIPAGINCGAACAANFARNSSVTLTAAPDFGSTFSGWSGNCSGTLASSSIIPASNANCAAIFAVNTYPITPTVGANGTVSPSTQIVNWGTATTFTVTPNASFMAVISGTCGGTLAGTMYTTTPINGFCSVVVIFVPATANFVSTTGNDTTGIGSISSPWKTIGFAVGRLVGGNTLVVRNGLYVGLPNFITNVPSGTAGQYTTIMAESPMEVRIQSTTTLQYDDNQLFLSGNYIKVDGFIFDLAISDVPPYIGQVDGSFNKITRSIFKRSGNIDRYGGLLELNGNDNLVEDTAGVGACRYCFKQGGTMQVTQRNIWRRVVARFDYGNSPEPKATFSTYGNDLVNTNVSDHLYQNAIAIDGQNPGNNGGEEKYGGFYTIKSATRVTLQGSMVLNEGVGYSGMHLRDYAIGLTNNFATNSVVWNLPGSNTGAVGVKGQPLDHLTIGGNIAGAAFNGNDPAPTFSLLKPIVAPANILNNTPGAVVLKRYGVTGTRWGEPGYDQLTTEDLWPWAFQDKIKAVFREVNSVPAGNNPTTNNTLRGFAANGNGLYGGPITLTSYIWEMTGTPCPPTVCF